MVQFLPFSVVQNGVSVSSSGTHSVCVCTQHQNTKLLVDGFCAVIDKVVKQRARNSDDANAVVVEKINVTYKDLMEKIVCDTTNLECMVHRCDNCPGYTALEAYVRDKFTELEIDDEIRYSQWESVDRTILKTHTSDVDDFIELLVYSVDNLTTHSFFAKSQAQYLKKRCRKYDVDIVRCCKFLHTNRACKNSYVGTKRRFWNCSNN